jgi:hypothetical protein
MACLCCDVPQSCACSWWQPAHASLPTNAGAVADSERNSPKSNLRGVGHQTIRALERTAKPANAPAINVGFPRRFGSESLREVSGLRAARLSPADPVADLLVGRGLCRLRVNAGFFLISAGRGSDRVRGTVVHRSHGNMVYCPSAARTAASASSQAL